MARKVFVETIVQHNTDGTSKPLFITWEDGRKYEVDKVIEVRPAPSLKAGGHGIRYTCRILGKETYLFNSENKWFVEGK